MLRAFNGEGKFVQQRRSIVKINVSPPPPLLFYRVQRQGLLSRSKYCLPPCVIVRPISWAGQTDRQRPVPTFDFDSNEPDEMSFQCFLPFSWISRKVRFHHLLQVYTSFKQIRFWPSASFFLSFHVFSFFSLKFQTNFRQSFQMCVS